MTKKDEAEYRMLMQAQIASAQAARHLLQQETFGFRNPAGKAVRIAFGLPLKLPAKDVIEVLDAYIEELELEQGKTC